MNLSNLFYELALNNGFSYNINTGESNPTTGYMVSLSGFEELFYFDDFESKNITNYIAKHINKLSDEQCFLGGWVTENQVFLDVSINLQDLELAILYGINGDQQSIFDCANNKTIELPSPQRSGTMTQNKTYNDMKAKQLAFTIKTTI